MQQDAAYTGLIPEIYDRYLGPMLFAPYAADIAERAKVLRPKRVLEIAAGTGIVTDALARALPDASIEATDLNQAMVDFASSRRAHANIRWSAADAQALPFEDKSFDLAVCQFGAMFFPDRAKAFREARRVLKDGGTYIVSLWEGLDRNDVPRIVSNAAMSIFPDDPPLFLRRTPYGHGDPVGIEKDLRSAGFSNVACDRVEKRGLSPSSLAAASGFVEGTPLRFEIEARDARRLQDVLEASTRALDKMYGGGTVDGLISAFVFTAS
ncbi:MAG TPA: class I SAM-dependent methyltransferase [Candidatus Eremiobacteraceae bacterium]|nr:class I SAM-dependent methyltransferase [Candidatus Eremiobacteraceae bacterium]